MRPHTAAEAGAVIDAVEQWQELCLRRARPAPRLRRRRVLPPGRPALPAGRRLRRLPPARERHRHGPGLRGRLPRRRGRPPTACSRGFFAWVDGAPAAGYRAPARTRRPSRRPSAAEPPGDRSAILTGEYGAAVLGPLLGRSGPTGRPAAAGAQRLLRRQHRRHRADDRRDVARALAAAAAPASAISSPTCACPRDASSTA